MNDGAPSEETTAKVSIIAIISWIEFSVKAQDMGVNMIPILSGLAKKGLSELLASPYCEPSRKTMSIQTEDDS
jgi:hypothetical protein